MLYDKNFLKELDRKREKTLYGRVTLLNINEEQIQVLEGTISQGSINVDGNSAIRRTCSLTMVSNDINFKDYLWTVTSKIRLEIGVENNIDKKYPSIIWFPQGIYILTSFNSSLSVNSYTINLQAKDKMCQLNGENGGTFQSIIDLGKYEQIDEYGNVEYIDVLIKDIIIEMVHTYGGEPFHNIIVNNLDELGLIAQSWRHDKPLYLIRDSTTHIIGEYSQAEIGGDTVVYCQNIYGNEISVLLKNLKTYDSLIGDNVAGTPFSLSKNEDKKYYAAQFEYGDIVGYAETKLTYPGELIANPGETVTSVLDKIITNFSDFEYFYNLEGQFVFQKKQNYLNTSFAPDIIQSEDSATYAIEPYFLATDTVYNFEGSELITAFNNTPNIANIKNDYSIWGKRGDSGAIPIHYRYAIDRKPTRYTTIQVADEDLITYNEQNAVVTMGQNSVTYIALLPGESADKPDLELINIYEQDANDNKVLELTDENIDQNDSETNKFITIVDSGRTFSTMNVVYCDWRELIYRMALDFRKYNHLDDFAVRVATANPQYPSGKTGYEQYYIDLEGFWRQLYSIEPQYNAVKFIEEKTSYYKKLNAEHAFSLITQDSPRKNGEKVYYRSSAEKEYPAYEIARLGRGNKWYDKKGQEINILYRKKDDYIAAYPSQTVYALASQDKNLFIMNRISAEDAYASGQKAYVMKPILDEKQQHSWPLYQVHEQKELASLALGNNHIFELIPRYSTQNIDGGEVDTGVSASSGLYEIVEATEEEMSSGNIELFTKIPYKAYYVNSPFGAGSALYEKIAVYVNHYTNEDYYFEKQTITEKGDTIIEYYKVLGEPQANTKYFTFRKVELYCRDDEFYTVHDNYAYWNKNIIEAPEVLNFWFDFLDTNAELARYAVFNIGVRPKVSNDDKVKAINYPNTPLCIYSDVIGQKTGYDYILFDKQLVMDISTAIIADDNGVIKSSSLEFVPALGAFGKSDKKLRDPIDNKEYQYWRYESYMSPTKKTFIDGWRGCEEHPLKALFSNVSQGSTAKSLLENLLYTHTYSLDAISVTAVPIYYLEPNKRIHLSNAEIGIEGDYLLSKISVPLAYNGTMNLTATKIYDRNL